MPTKIDIDNYNFWTFLLNMDYNLTAYHTVHIIINIQISRAIDYQITHLWQIKGLSVLF